MGKGPFLPRSRRGVPHPQGLEVTHFLAAWVGHGKWHLSSLACTLLGRSPTVAYKDTSAVTTAEAESRCWGLACVLGFVGKRAATAGSDR